MNSPNVQDCPLPQGIGLGRLWLAGLVFIALAYVFAPERRAVAGDRVSFPFPGVQHVFRVSDQPWRTEMHLVIIDLDDPHIRFQVVQEQAQASGADQRKTTSHFLHRIHAQIAINGGFFDALGHPVSLSVSNGQRITPWHSFDRNHNYGFDISRENKVTFIDPLPGDSTGYGCKPLAPLYNALAGNVRLMRDGAIPQLPKGDPTYPQTAVAATGNHKLILFVVDGRRPEISHGMAYEQVARVLQSFGAVDAVALDGGGSATLVMADGIFGWPHVINHPSDGRERPVGNCLAVFVSK